MSQTAVQRFAGIIENERRGVSVNPFELLPASTWVEPTMAYLNSMPEGLVKSSSVFCYNLRIWHQHEGLTLEELCAIYRAMKKPERMAEMSFGENKHYAIFAGLVAQVCKARRIRQASEEQRQREQAAIEERRQNPQLFADLMTSLMTKWKRG